MRLRIKVDDIDVVAELSDENPETSRAIADALPFEGSANVWGDEIYFEIPVTVLGENGRQDVEVGEIAYWPVGRAMCVFFGPTPVSDGPKPKAYSPVNVFGRIIGDALVFKAVKDGAIVRVERLSS